MQNRIICAHSLEYILFCVHGYVSYIFNWTALMLTALMGIHPNIGRWRFVASCSLCYNSYSFAVDVNVNLSSYKINLRKSEAFCSLLVAALAYKKICFNAPRHDISWNCNPFIIKRHDEVPVICLFQRK